MNKILYAPILNIMEERKNFIDKNYKTAEENNTKSQELTQEKEEKILIISWLLGEHINPYTEYLMENLQDETSNDWKRTAHSLVYDKNSISISYSPNRKKNPKGRYIIPHSIIQYRHALQEEKEWLCL